jgi:hypothetical protein
VEKLEKRYVRHFSANTNEELFDDLMKQDIKKLTNEGWAIKAVAAPQDQGEARAVIVTFERKKQT